MTFAISAAEPSKLLRYSEIAARIDQELIIESNHLGEVLSRFEATCTESGFQLRVSGIADTIRGYAHRNAAIDYWVHNIGLQFQLADRSHTILVLSDDTIQRPDVVFGPTVLEMLEWLENLKLVIGTSLIIAFLKPGPKPHQFVIDLPNLRSAIFKPQAIRTWGGLSKTFNGGGWKVLPGHIAKRSLGSIMLIVIVVMRWTDDILAYEGTELMSALVVDAVLGLAPVIVGIVASSVVAGLIVAFAPVTVPGIVVAGVIFGTSVVATIVADWVLGKIGARDWAIPRLRNLLDSGINWVSATANKTVTSLDREVFGPIAQAIAEGTSAFHELVDTASRRLREDFDNAPNSGMPEVLGITSVKPGIWSQTLDGQRQAIESVILDMKSQLSQIDKAIQALEARKVQINQAIEDNWWYRWLPNSLSPLDWSLGFDDRGLDAPWKTKTDDLENEMRTIEKNLSRLYDRQQYLKTILNEHESSLGKLRTTDEEIEKLLMRYDGTRYVETTSNTNAGEPTDALIRGLPGTYDPRLYSAVINQFAVENNPRYVRNHQGRGETYCNIFVWDVTRAMGAEIPHWVDVTEGVPSGVGQGTELDANGTLNWLDSSGKDYGWTTIDAEQAQLLANLGFPVVAGWHDYPIGHIAVVRPGEYSTIDGPNIAQAGGSNYNNTRVSIGFPAGWNDQSVVFYTYLRL